MNKHLHRIVFNASRGQMMAVAETASSHQLAASGEAGGPGRALVATLNALTFSMWVALGLVTLVQETQAQVIADRSAPARQQPTILATPSGAPLVNIQTPSAAGVSRNTYSQFDVNAQGVVLNNSRNGATSQVAGAVGPNPWLARGTARVILNEVNSNDPSKLKGYVEVAGDKAQVVIANPSGITCDGCGFINASRATVTTGTPIINGGHLDGYRVERGTVNVEGRGMDARGADYTDVIARAVNINAEMSGKEIKVRQGPAVVSADNSQASPIQGTGDKPVVGIDVAKLGGMYANKIVLIGGEAGVGVRNAGNLGASAGDVVITADGMLTNTGRITATGQVTADANGGIDNSGTVYAGTDTSLKTRGRLANTGTGLIASTRHTTLEAGEVSVDADAMVAAGLHTTGEGDQAKTEIAGAVGDLTITASDGVSAHGTLAAAGDLRVTAKLLDFGQARLSGQNLLFAALEGQFDAKAATVMAGQSLTVRGAQGFNTDGATLSAGTLDVQVQSWSNRGGQAVQAGAGVGKVQVQGALDNTDGTVASFGSLQVKAGSADNTRGRILTSEDTQEGAAPKALGTGDLSLRVDSLNNTSGVVNATKGKADVMVDGKLVNGADSHIGADGMLTLTSAGLENRGTLRGGGITIDARGQALDNAGGMIVSSGDVSTRSAGFNNDGGLVLGERLNLDAQGAGISNHQSDAAKDRGLVGKSGISLTNASRFDNTGGYVYVGDEGLKVNGAVTKNAQGGLIEGTGAVTITASDFDNHGGKVRVAGGVTVQVGAGTINNTGGLIGSGDAVDLGGGKVVNSNTVQIDAAQANAAEDKETQAAAQLGIQGNSVQITAETVANDKGLIVANDTVTINGKGQVDNTGGTISAGRALHIIDASGTGPDVGRLVVTNTGGTLIANEALQVSAARLTGDGKVHSNGDFEIKLGSALANSGEMTAGRNLLVTTAGGFTNSGTVSAGNALNVNASAINNTTTGEITAMSTTLDASGQITNRGLINGDDTVLKADTITNIGTGRIYGTRLGLQADRVFNTDESDAASLGARGGLRSWFHPWNASWYQASTEGEQGLVDSGKSGVIAARERLDIGARDVRNFNGAEISSGGDIHFGSGLDANNQATGQAWRVTNSSALIDSGGDIGWHNVDNVVNTRTKLVFNSESVTTHDQTVMFDTGGAGLYRSVKDIATTVNTTTLDKDKSSAAGVIRSDGAMDFGSANVRNEASGIYAFGGIKYDQSRYTALSTLTVETLTQGTTISFLRDSCSWYNGCSFKNNRMTTEKIAGSDTSKVTYDSTETELRGSEIKSGDATQYAQATQGADALKVSASGGSSQAVLGAQATPSSGTTPSAGEADPNAPKTVEIRAGSMTLQVPKSSLFTTSNDPQARTLVTTDAKFAGYRQWLDSNYLLRELGVDPNTVGRRLGDGYYEQRLIREQTSKLLGARLLDKDVNNEREYIALMTNAIDYAKKNNLKIGTALTADQVANLTSDIVWMEYHDVTLSDGSKLQALVPQVYAMTKVQESAGPGQLGKGVIAANRIDYTVNGDFSNSNALTARDALTIRADSIQNAGGLLQAGTVALNARTDIVNQGGRIVGTDAVSLVAGRDISLLTTTQTSNLSNSIFRQDTTRIDKVASVGVTGAQGSLVIEAGRDLKLKAAEVFSTGEGGQSALTAKSDIRLDSAWVSNDFQYYPDAGNFGRHTQAQDVGSVVATSGDLQITAGKNLSARAASVSSEKGATILEAGQDMNLAAGRKEQLDDDARQSTRHGLIKDKSTTTRDTVSTSTSVGTMVAGDQVQLKAGNDVQLEATQVTSAKLLDIQAGRDVSVLAGKAALSESHMRKEETRMGGIIKTMADAGNPSAALLMLEKKASEQTSQLQQTASVGSELNAGTLQVRSGRDTKLEAATLVADDGIVVRAERNLSLLAAEETQQNASHSASSKQGNVGSWYLTSFGKVSQSQNASGSSTTLAGTQVMSLNGTVSLQAGEDYQQTASQVLAPKGDVQIVAKQVTIEEGQETGQSHQDSAYKKTAFGGVVSIPLLNAAKSIKGMVQASEDTKSDRMKAMAAFNTAMAAKEAVGAVTDLMGGGMGGIKIGVSLSHNQSKSSSDQSGTNAVGSVVAAGGNVDIRATGAGTDSQLTVSGSQIDGGQNVLLKSDGAVTLKAGQDTAHQRSKDSSSGVSLGVSLALGGAQNGFTIDFAASMARGKSDGDDLAWKNTHVTAGNAFRIESGGDTTLSGAVVTAPQISGDIKGNLKIDSLQDSSTYNSKQVSGGVSVSLCIPPICEGLSTIGGSYGQSKIDSNYLAVTEQTGFKAGDGGYQIKVGGDTALNGGVIASSQKAIDDGKNSFDHQGSVTLQNINNRVEFNGESFAVSGSVGTKLGDQSNASNFGNKVGEWSKPGGTWDADAGKTSTNQAKPAETNVEKGSTLVVGKDSGRQPSASFGYGSDSGLQTSVTRAGIGVSTSEDTAGVIAPIFNAARVQSEINAQTKITQTFSQVAPKAVADFANSRMQTWKDAQAYNALQQPNAGDGNLSAEDKKAMLGELEKRGMTAEKAQQMVGDPQAKLDYERWGDGGVYRVALHALVGGVGGGWDGALGAGTVAAASPALDDIQRKVNESLIKSGMNPQAAQLASQGLAELTAAGLGSVVGGNQGAGYGFAVDTNNRQLHPKEVAFLQDKSRIRRYVEFVKEKLGQDITEVQALKELDGYGAAMVDDHWTGLNGRNAVTESFIQQEAKGWNYIDSSGVSHSFFIATAAERKDETINLKPLFDAYGENDTNVRGFLNSNFNATRLQDWNSRFANGQHLGYVDAGRNSSVLGDAGTLASGLIHLIPALYQTVKSDEVGPIDSARMQFYYQTLLKLQGRAEEAGYVSEYSWTNTQRLSVLGLAMGEGIGAAWQVGKGYVLAGRGASSIPLGASTAEELTQATRQAGQGSFAQKAGTSYQYADGGGSAGSVVPPAQSPVSLAGAGSVTGDLAAAENASAQQLKRIEFDSGKPGAWNSSLNKSLESNASYIDKTTGYNYATDSLGRVTEVSGNLVLDTAERNTYQQKVSGRLDRLSTDQGGHLIASIFRGPGEGINLVPMDANLNMGAWRSMESGWAAEIAAGNTVSVRVQPIYSSSSVRPDAFAVTQQVGTARPVTRFFKNKPGG